MINDIIVEKSSPEARGLRVRRLRNMANLSRQDMCRDEEFKLDTLIGWELARHGGLTQKGAVKIIKCVAKEGVICTVEWLLYNIGSGPIVVTNSEDIQESLIKTSPVTDEDQFILEELLLFRKNNPDSVELHIMDDHMSPIYNKGDYIAGIKRYQDKLQSTIGFDCIVKPFEGEIKARRVLAGNLPNQYTLLPINLTGETSSKILTNIPLIFAAPIIWHRRKNPI